MSNDGADLAIARPPVAPVDPVIRELHGIRRIDDYAWLRDKGSARSQAYFGQERAYYDASTAHQRPLRQQLLAEMSQRTLPADESVAWVRAGYSYLTRTLEGREYTQLLRKRGEDLAAEGPYDVIFDENEWATGHDYLSVDVCEPSPNAGVLAFAIDLAGDEVYALRFRDLDTGDDLPDVVPSVMALGRLVG